MKLNSEKCVFGVPLEQLLGFLISKWGIEANHEKIKAILGMKKPENLNVVQKLTGCIATLSQFISRLDEKALPFYRLLKKLVSSNGQTKLKLPSKISSGCCQLHRSSLRHGS